MRDLDPVVTPLTMYARMRRKERSLDTGARKSLLRALQGPYRQAFSSLSRLAGLDVHLPGLSEEEARQAELERSALLDSLRGLVNISANGTKLHKGPLSPGCVTCQDGDWDCNLLNRRCNRNCDFCKRPHSMAEERPSTSEGFEFTTPQEHVAFLSSYGIKGVGFSGGEPLLVEERLLSHVRAIRAAFGQSMYVWMYTNGDLVERPVLRRLKQAGIDEIRFNLSARGYDLAPVVLAREFLPAVTVEIPAIPEDFELVRELLAELQAIGVDYLNLHQLYLSTENWRALLKRSYRYTCDPGIAVFESELCALRLLLHACERSLTLPVNYCSHAYRLAFPPRGVRNRRARATLEDHQELTPAGYIRQLTVADAHPRLAAMISRMQRDGLDAVSWKLSRSKRELCIHSSALSHVDWSTASLTIEYLEPGLSLRDRAMGAKFGSARFGQSVVGTVIGLGRAAADCWSSLYIGEGDREKALGELYQRQRGDGRGPARARWEIAKVRGLARWEELRGGLSELY